jgi:hypothetical protein
MATGRKTARQVGEQHLRAPDLRPAVVDRRHESRDLKDPDARILTAGHVAPGCIAYDHAF